MNVPIRAAPGTAEADGGEPLLALDDLRVSFAAGDREIRAVDGLSLELRRGEALALVGESGAGKSATATALLALEPAARVQGSIRLGGRELVGASAAELRGVRGDRIAIVFQDPASALDPVQRVGPQIAEQIEAHARVAAANVDACVIELLERVRLPNARDVARRYPFELSGGMRQRVLIAMAISCDPDVLVADEPTAALDAVVQAEVLTLLDELKREHGMATLLATHDLRAVARVADRIAVMRAGRVVEEGPAADLLERPRHEHTRRLLRRPGGSRRETVEPPPGSPAHGRRPRDRETLLDVSGLEVRFRGPPRPFGRRGEVRAVTGASLALAPGETLALVGRSGSGKTTVARAVLRLVEPAAGSIRFRGRELTALGQRALRPVRRELQAVFQDPAASLNPRRRVGAIVAAPLRRNGVGRADAHARARSLLERVELPPELAARFPHELSGGQRQRVGIARALALEPRLVVLDEPVTALDAPVRAQVLDLLDRLQRELGPAYLLIAHDLELVARVAHRVAVMHDGAVVESGTPAELLERPRHPATQALVAASYAAAREAK